jgi:hypothetical protein
VVKPAKIPNDVDRLALITYQNMIVGDKVRQRNSMVLTVVATHGGSTVLDSPYVATTMRLEMQMASENCR